MKVDADKIANDVTTKMLDELDKLLDKYVERSEQDTKPSVNHSNVQSGSPDPSDYFDTPFVNHADEQSGSPDLGSYFK
ncbi:TPA: hypothetical protein KD853_002846 [Vibrio parahaemolyticus]|nr:hypothetical protein [Vibrio parahaemolyticus]